MNIHELWGQVKMNMFEKYGQATYEAFISNLEPISYQDGVIVLVAENQFFKESVANRYIDDITFFSKNIDSSLKEVIVATNDEIKSLNINRSGDSQPEYDLNLNPEYTFEKFVVGKNNDFAQAACHNVAENPSKQFNPLFLYGGVGLGKTHLMQAIAHRVLSKFKDKRVMYVTSEKFTNELINILRTSNNENYKTKFRNKYRNADILIIDDIQFIAGKDSVQEEFFHTFNDLYAANKQIIISSDRPPKEITMLEERLSSRFDQGLKVDIKAPDYETRMAILMNKAEGLGLEIPYDVIEYIANNVNSNIRELEGALTRLSAFATLKNQKTITMELAVDALKDIFENLKNKEVTVDRIKEKVAEEHNISIMDMDSKKRSKAIAYPRQIAMYICRELTDLSLPKIGSEFGGRDHTTVLHACNKIEQDIKENEDIKIRVDKVITKIKG